MQVTCRLYVDVRWVELQLPDDGRLTLDPADGHTAILDGLPAGWQCAVVPRSLGLATSVAPGGPAVIEAGAQAALEVLYDWQLGTVVVGKRVHGSSTAASFGFAATCTAVDFDGPEPVTVPIPLTGDSRFTLAPGAQHSVTALAGATCIVSEPGNGGAVATTAALDGGAVQPLGSGAAVTLSAQMPSTLDVVNAFPLPVTGGTLGEPAVLALLGGALLGIGVTLVIRRRISRVVR